ncbi:hypothetical protein IAQ61_003618 [Plenodomus lingam]|uniref:uncharacterized protein n=1 Tax=Leptosphaeria maculans TaxID=5022 RepID=UPI0033194ABB|nr:hypothetical protein IAQ61_003618 [Plenodomus lingam]
MAEAELDHHQLHAHQHSDDGFASHESSPRTLDTFIDSEHESDLESCATTVPETVMAEQVANDVVKEAQSVGRSAPIDDSASTTSTPAVNGELPSAPTTSKHDSPQQSSAAANANKPEASSADGARMTGKQGQDTLAKNQNQEQDSHDAAPPVKAVPLVNGDSSDHLASESLAVADASGGSDTDISRPGSVDQSKREPGHVRSSSTVKKPSTFKSVSVTKNFLAKSVVSAPTARPGDKVAPAAQTSTSSVLTPKPRLVAKLGTSNTPRTPGKVNGAASGPDASKVWNKNQPVPPPPPKQYTDEELKQQYGIHLATRLQTDEGGKEAKWADIDDDEDDWAPDTVQWMDGTKSSVTAAESQPPAAEEPKTILKPEPPVAAPEPAPAAPAAPTNTPKASVTGGSKTILKPGAHAQPTTGKTSLVLKGQPEKPTLVAKPSATEKKSPWATLPPVEKVSPIPINPPAPQQAPRYPQRESYSQDSRQQPAQEIAPDDFNRTWRDERGNAPELYNSHNGRYEPVNDMRRPSARDAGFRQQPSVLQRPSQGGPAEPSAAFQTSRANGDAPTWGRRRNSSNVSAGNMRRMSIDRRGPDMPNGPMGAERRGSQMNGSDFAEAGAARQPPFAQAVSPNTANAHPASPYSSVTSSTHRDHSTLTALQAPPPEDPVEVQKRLMADKIERARLKKQQEQEAEKKAEAERKERIAKKLAALGPPADSKSKTKEQSPSRPAEQSPQKEKAVPAAVQSPPKPPVPTADGEVAQYGMMKVHQPHTVKKASPQTEPAKTVKPAEQAQGSLPVKTQTEVQAQASSHALNQPAPQSVDSFPREPDKDKPRQPAGDQSRNLDRAVPAGPKPQASQTTWTPATTPQSRGWTSQVWGPPPTRERALGNGTFVDPGYNRGQARPGQQQLPAQSSTPIAPIGASLASSQASASHGSKQMPSQAMYTQPKSRPAQAMPSKPGPIAPPLAKGWGNFEADIANDDRKVAMKAQQDRERLGEFRPEIRETYKDQRGQAQTTLHSKVAPNVVLPDAITKKDDATPKPLLEGSPSQTLGQGTSLQQPAGPRASRFFPRPIEPMTPAATTASMKADSPPPPPETSAHPVFSGDFGRPQVKLPKPSPVVRLPPCATGSVTSEGSVTMPLRGQQSIGSRPLAMNPEWQARFNKLLEKPGAPATVGPTARAPSAVSSTPGALAPTAHSKASLEVRGAPGPATVSLPHVPQNSLFATDQGSDPETRKGTEALFEDREFGSLPTVKLPKTAHLAAAEPAVSAPKDDLPPRFKKQENPFTIRRLEAFDLDKSAQKVDVPVHLPGMHQPITKSMPRRRRGPKTGGQFKPKQTGGPNGSAANGSKERPRKPSGQADRPGSSSRSAPTNTWSNNGRSNPAPQQTTWARRAAAAH